MIELKGKNALVTGSSRGVGQQIAQGLAALGCNVIVHGRTIESCTTTLQLLQKYNVKCYCVYGELSDEIQVDNLIKQVQNINISVNILYNNAAIMTNYQEDFWKHSMNTEGMNVNKMSYKGVTPYRTIEEYDQDVLYLIGRINKLKTNN